MTDIGPIGGGASTHGVSRPHLEAEARAAESRPGDRAQTRSARRGADRVEVSSIARELSRMQDPVRQDLIGLCHLRNQENSANRGAAAD